MEVKRRQTISIFKVQWSKKYNICDLQQLYSQIFNPRQYQKAYLIASLQTQQYRHIYYSFHPLYSQSSCQILKNNYIIYKFLNNQQIANQRKMQLKIQWLLTHKDKVYKQLSQLQIQNKDIISQLLRDNKAKEVQLNKLHNILNERQSLIKDEINKYLLQMKTLENIIVNKDDVIDTLKKNNEDLTLANNDKIAALHQTTSRLLQIQHLYNIQKISNQKQHEALQKQLQLNQTKNKEQILKLKEQSEQKLISKQKQMNKLHDQQLLQIKKNNMIIIQKIQNEYKNISNKSTQSIKQIQIDSTRLVGQNTKLLGIVNQFKYKNVNLESNISNYQQQLKILQKQLEINKENNKRECQFLKDQRNQINQKNKRLNDKVQDLMWKNREIQLKKQEDIKKLKKEVDKSFEQILQNSQNQNKKMEELNKKLGAQLMEKERQLKEMESISVRLKEMFEDLQKQTIKLREYARQTNQKEKAKDEVNLMKVNDELKNEIVRKNCELQVLQDEIKRLKTKINNILSTHEQYQKNKDIMQKQNKMLLSQIIFLRDKDKKNKNMKDKHNVSNSNFLSDMNSQQSKVEEDIQNYKKLIQAMSEQINEVSKKVIDKDVRIQKLEALVRRYQLQLRVK